MSVIENIVNTYKSNPSSILHVQFRVYTQMSFENTYKHLCKKGFVKKSEDHVLNVIHNVINADIKTSARIKDFCKNNMIPTSTEYYTEEELTQDSIDEYNIKTKLFTKRILQKDGQVKSFIHKWNTKSKIYTLNNTIVLKNRDGLEVHFIISKRDERGFKLSDSSVFNAKEIYNIRIVPTEYTDTLVSDIRIVSKYILVGLQNSDYPLKKSIMESIKTEYKETYGGTQLNFIGPSSFTLQQINLIESDDDSIPYVLDNFCVTDKADGERRILYISNEGRVYLISTKLELQYTGTYVTNELLYGIILDGEYITHDKSGNKINMYAAFDVYILNIAIKGVLQKKDIRPFEFAKNRYKLLKKCISDITESLTLETGAIFSVHVKKFYFNTSKRNLYNNCKSLFKSMKTKEYNTDGIILTHELFGVGMTDKDTKIKNSKSPWTHSFKWKPPEQNTIDFKVYIIKEPPTLLKSPVTNKLEPYIKIHLYVGNPHSRYTNIQNILLMGKPPPNNKKDNVGKFMPTREIDDEAYICFLPHVEDVDGNYKIFSEDGSVIEHEHIVEFSYELEADKHMRWKPLRVRHDKLYPNGFDTANSNWYSIHHPVTPEMLLKPSEIKDMSKVSSVINDQIYYEEIDKSSIKTKKLKHFHHVVKYFIYDAVLYPRDELKVIDFSIGHGADINKYMNKKVKYLLGIDIASSNIHSTTNGPAKRYLDIVKDTTDKVYMFIEGDSSKPILSGNFSDNQISKDVIDIYFGKNDIRKYPALNDLGGKFRSGFDVGSIQFTIHYMFENIHTLHGFAKNCHDMIKEQGYLVGTCYDGKKVFRLLSDESKSHSMHINGKKICDIVKKYTADTFNDDETSLGLKISVFQETLGRYIDEYLVNFEYFKTIMELYGFTADFKLVDDKKKPISTINNFESLYKEEIRLHDSEKQISFLNNYFIFKKIKTVDSDRIYHRATQSKRIDTIVSSNAINIGEYEIKVKS